MIYAIAGGSGLIVILLVIIVVLVFCRKPPPIPEGYVPKNQIAAIGDEKLEDVSMEHIGDMVLGSGKIPTLPGTGVRDIAGTITDYGLDPIQARSYEPEDGEEEDGHETPHYGPTRNTLHIDDGASSFYNTANNSKMSSIMPDTAKVDYGKLKASASVSSAFAIQSNTIASVDYN